MISVPRGIHWVKEMPPSRRLLLHVGPPKTGTSAIQRIFSSQRFPNWIYPEIGLWTDGAHHNLTLNFFARYHWPQIKREEIGDLFSQIGKLTRESDGNIFISTEAMWIEDIPKFLRALQRYLSKEQWSVEILVVYREGLRRAASVFNQMVKDEAVHLSMAPAEFLNFGIDFLLYEKKIRALEQCEFKLSVISYQPHMTLVRRVLDHIGLPAQAIEFHIENQSLSRKALVAAFLMNKLKFSYNEKSQVLRHLAIKGELHGAAPMIFNQDTVAKFSNVFQQDARFMYQRYQLEDQDRDSPSKLDEFFVSSSELEELELIMAAHSLPVERFRRVAFEYVK